MAPIKQAPQRKVEVKDVPMDARSGEEMRKRVIVLPFLDSELSRSQNVVDIARKTVIEDLNYTRQFIVINNSDFPQDLAGFLKDNKEYDMAAISKTAANMGISAIVEGRILEIRARKMGDEMGVFRKVKATADVTVQVRVYGAKGGREIYSAVKKATVETQATRVGDTISARELEEDPNLVRDGVRKAFATTVPGIIKAVEKLSWEGRVALVNGDRLYLNAGRISGIQIGDILKITEDGDEVFDPETGSFIGLAPGRMKGTVEVVSYFGKDGAIAVIHSGSGFKENDKIELY
ncbi:MAG: hypothetical protein AABZ31_07585 [Bdellovibrionota bacterium]